MELRRLPGHQDHGGPRHQEVRSEDVSDKNIWKFTSVVRCGVAVAPVTDWRHYDTDYTERYMGPPGDNWRGYTGASVTTNIGHVRDNTLMVILRPHWSTAGRNTEL